MSRQGPAHQSLFWYDNDNNLKRHVFYGKCLMWINCFLELEEPFFIIVKIVDASLYLSRHCSLLKLNFTGIHFGSAILRHWLSCLTAQITIVLPGKSDISKTCHVLVQRNSWWIFIHVLWIKMKTSEDFSTQNEFFKSWPHFGDLLTLYRKSESCIMVWQVLPSEPRS